MRKAAERGDKELFQSFLPQSSLIATDDILEILGVKIRDEQDKVEEAAHIPMGIFLRLIEEVVEEGYDMFGSYRPYLQDITPPGKRDEEEESKEKEHWRGNLYTMLDTLRHIQGREGEKYENLTDEILVRLNDPHPVDVKDEEGNIQSHRWWIEKHYPEDILDEWDVLIAGYTNVEAIKTILKALKRQPPEEELEEISAMGLGSAEMSARKTYKRDDKISKKKKKNLQEDDELIDEIADYLLSKLGV